MFWIYAHAKRGRSGTFGTSLSFRVHPLPLSTYEIGRDAASFFSLDDFYLYMCLFSTLFQFSDSCLTEAAAPSALTFFFFSPSVTDGVAATCMLHAKYP